MTGSPKFRVVLLALLSLLCVGTVALRVGVAIVYVPLSVDGGWAAYPALSLARGDSAVESASAMLDLPRGPGVHARYGFDDRSVRLFPLSWWFKAFGAGLVSCRLYSLTEYLAALAAMAWFLRSLGIDKSTRFLSLALFAGSMGALEALTDLRPDVILTALSLLAFSLLVRLGPNISRLSFWLGCISLATVAVSWPSSPIPITIVSAYVALGWVTAPPAVRRTAMPGVLALMAFPMAAFLLRDKFNDLVFGIFPGYDESWAPGIAAMWRTGVWALLSKEFGRWHGTFFNSGIFVLAWIAIGLALVARAAFTERDALTRRASHLFIACCCAALVLFAVDRQGSPNHALPVIPFLIGAAAIGMQRIGKWRIEFAASILAASLAAACVPSIRLALECEDTGYSNAAVDAVVRILLPAKGDSRIGIGPTALFPQLHCDGSLVLIDDRSAHRLPRLDLAVLDFILIDSEYVGYNFEGSLASVRPEHRFTQVATVGRPERGPYLKILAREASGRVETVR
jgi:hypothetical protein